MPKKKPTQYLKDGELYIDWIMFTPKGMRRTGVGQVMIGTDYPFPRTCDTARRMARG